MSTRSGKTNSFKQGLYAKNLTPLEQSRARKMPMDDLCQEIIVLRVIVARLLELITNQDDIEKIDKVMLSLANIIKTISTTLRAQALLTGSHSELDEALAEALAAEPFYLDGSGSSPAAQPMEEDRDEERELWKKVFGTAPQSTPPGPL